jgi:hypothetical protein
MITTDRDVFVGAHVTFETKEALREEAERRNVSMSLLVSTIIEEWLPTGAQEQVEPVRSNRRKKHPVNPNEIDVPLPLEG